MKVKRWKLFSLAGLSAGILVATVALAAASGGGGGNGSSANSAAPSGSTSTGGSNGGGSGSQSGTVAQGGTGHSTNGQSGNSHGATNTVDRPAASSHGSSGANGLFTSGVPSSCGKGNGGPCPPPTGPPNGPPTVGPVFSVPPITTSCGKGNNAPCPVGPNGFPPYPPPLMSTNMSANDVVVLQPNQTSTYSLGGFAPGSAVTIVLNGQQEATTTANGSGSVLFTASCAGSSVSINGGPAVSNGSNSYAGSASDGSTSQGFTVRI